MDYRLATLAPFIAAMALVVIVSNVLVQYPFGFFGLGEVLTWGAFTYPFAFLVNDLSNRQFGPAAARRVVASGFFIAVILSILLASPRIAIASGSAFLVAQLLDTGIFERLRGSVWWRAPFVSTVIGSVVDTAIFFTIAFAPYFAFLDTAIGLEDGSLGFPVQLLGVDMPLYLSLALGDFSVKLIIGLVALIPYAAFLRLLQPSARIA